MITTNLIKALQEYFNKQKDVTFAMLYGSVAKNKVTPLSDLDVAVFFCQEMNQEQMGEMQIEITCDLMNLCEMNNIDVTILNLASPFLKFQVIKSGQLLKCRNKNEFYGFKARVLGEYQDIKPMFDMYADATIQSFKRYSYG